MSGAALTDKAKAIFPKLSRFRTDFYLAGGTALALQITHRVSVDFDLFTDEPIPERLLRTVEKVFAVHDREVMVNNTDELTVGIDGVKTTFLCYPFPPLLPLRYEEPIPLLSVKEILATKAYTIGRRGEFKDYVDLYAGVKGGYATCARLSMSQGGSTRMRSTTGSFLSSFSTSTTCPMHRSCFGEARQPRGY